MNTLSKIFLLLLSLTLTACANTPINSDRVVIPFANSGGIQDWRAVGEKAILLKARNNQWYRATFNRRCFNLNDSLTRSIGFKAGPTGSFDKHSEIIVDGQTCHVNKLETWLDPDEIENTDNGKFVS